MAEQARVQAKASGRGISERRCVATGETLGRDEGLRFVLGPDGALVFDVAGRLPGRGIWLSARRDVIEKAKLDKAFSRAARQKVALPEGWPEPLRRALTARALASLGLARRAGLTVAGLEKVRAALIGARARALLQAEDAALGPRRRLAALGRGRRTDLRLYGGFSAEDQGAAIGRGPTVHLALLEGGATTALLRDLDRLAGLGWTGSELLGNQQRDDADVAAGAGSPGVGLGERPLDSDDDG